MGTVRVKATQLGFDGMQRRREGEEFDLVDKKMVDRKTKQSTVLTGEDQFSERWMKRVKAKSVDEDEDDKADKGKAKSKTTRASDETRI